jgi:hypothetical protein
MPTNGAGLSSRPPTNAMDASASRWPASPANPDDPAAHQPYEDPDYYLEFQGGTFPGVQAQLGTSRNSASPLFGSVPP